MVRPALISLVLGFLAVGALSAKCTVDIPFCSECDSAGTTCTVCGNYFFLLKDKSGCGWACNTSSDLIEGNVENPYYVPHALTCIDYYTSYPPTDVAECEPGYYKEYSDGSYICTRCASTQVSDEDNHCAVCARNSYSTFFCKSCKPGWDDPSNFCNVPGDCKNGGGAIEGCLTCQTGDPNACASCDRGYYLRDGNCIPAVLYETSDRYVPHCSASRLDTPNLCGSCEAGYMLSDTGTYECVPCVDSSYGPDDSQHCAKCSTGWYGLYCDRCMPGYTGTYNFCLEKIDCSSYPPKVDGCKTCDTEYPLKCAECDSDGTISDPNDPYTCYPRCSTNLPGIPNTDYIPHCVKCYEYNKKLCTKCEPGWASTDGYYGGTECKRCEKAGVTDSLSDQHCADCYFSSYSNEISYCRSCMDGWADTDTFCSQPVTCTTSSNPIEDCRECETVTTCRACKTNYKLSADKTKCIPVCIVEGDEHYIPNCVSCSHYGRDGIDCSACDVGYYLASDYLSCIPCTNSTVGDVENQHCATCSRSYYDGTVTCTTCQGGWDDPENFCNVTRSCSGGAYAIDECISCQTSDPSRCAVCSEGWIVTDEGRRCIPLCSDEDPDNPWAIEHCAQCSTIYGDQCRTCESGYISAQSNKACVAAGTCFPPIPGCVKCSDTNASYCAQCNSETTLGSGICYAKCGGKTITGCMTCSTTDPTKCEVCGSSYFLAPDGSTCYHMSCYEAKGDFVTECSGRGTCRIEDTGYARCDCSSYFLESTTTNTYCRCAYNYYDGPNGECYQLMEGCGFPMGNCSSCSLYGSSPNCAGCNEGWYGRALMCRQNMQKRQCTSVSYWDTEGKCSQCNENGGFELAEDGWGYYCVPKKVCTDDSMGENCAFCPSSYCSRCLAGYSGTSTGCSTVCNTGIAWCSECDGNDPTVCTVCVRGEPPYCLGFDYSCGWYDSDEVGGYYEGEKCIHRNCATIDPTIFGGVYGPNIQANVTCARHGTCVDDTNGEKVCSCNPGENRDPATKCATCLPGYVMDGDTCVTASGSHCPEHCRVCDKQNKCLACADGYTDKDNGCDKACTELNCAVCEPSNPSLCIQCVATSTQVWVPANDTYICKSICTTGCPSGKMCVRDENGLPTCVPYAAAGAISLSASLYAVCAYRGTYDLETETCTCDLYTTNSDCSGCADNAVLDRDTYKCVLDTTDGCPDCLSGTKCANFNGNLICYPTACVTGVGASTKICNGAGICGTTNKCVCDDPLMDPDQKCAKCVSGYVYSGVTKTCVPGSCLEGENLVLYCTECRKDNPALCAACTNKMVPDFGGTRCVPCGAYSSVNAEGTECVCDNSRSRPNGANRCATYECGLIANCKRCYSGDSRSCGECEPNYYLSEDRKSCVACPAGQVTGPGGRGCMCAPGTEPAGDDPTKCIDPLCHKGTNKIVACTKCKASNPSECHTCHAGMVYNSATRTCGCPDGQAVDTNGNCAPTACESISGCKLCYGNDPSLCGMCEPPLMPNVARTACVCAPGMQLTSAGKCIVPICLMGKDAIPHCVACSEYATAYCSQCREPFRPSFDGKSCICSGGYVESNAQTCVPPTCIVSEGSNTGVPGCIVCDAGDSSKCASCASPLTLDNVTNSCAGCREGEVPQSDGSCNCPTGQEYSENRNCVDPLCKTSVEDPYCETCMDAPSNNRCAVCTKGHRVGSDGKCVCPPNNAEGDDGNCIVPVCLENVYGCTICRTSSPSACAVCIEHMVPATGGGSCICARDYEFASDDRTCIIPTCKQGTAKVDYCDACAADDTAICGRCLTGRTLSADGKTCSCPSGTESANDGTCVTPLCKQGSTKVENCATCSGPDPTKCSACDKKMVVIDNGAGCACTTGQELIDGECARPTCLKGSTAVRNCVRCGYVATQCIECSNGKAPVDNVCTSGNLSGGAIAGIVIAVVLVVAAIVVTVVILIRKRNTAGPSKAKYVNMQGGEMTTSASL